MSMTDIGAIWRRDGQAVHAEALSSFLRALAPLQIAQESLSVQHTEDRRCALISSYKAAQLYTASTRCMAVADSHIHNRKDLRKRLRLEHEASHHNDADHELVAHAYHRWGTGLADNLVGDFSVCLFDMEENKLHVFRDRLGCKPLYYAQTTDYVLICSQIQAILNSGLVQQDVYQPRLADHIVLRSESAEPNRTFFKAVLRVMPAHVLTFTSKHHHSQRYWSLTPPTELKLTTQQEYQEAFREALQAAVKRSLDTKKKLSCMLSGGIDSSAICAGHRQIVGNTDSLNTLSAITHPSAQASCIESRSSALVAAHLKSNHFTVDPDKFASLYDNLGTNFQASTNMFDSLMMNTSLAVMRLAQDQRTGVLLDGLDGESIVGFSGGSPLAESISNRRFSAAYNEVCRLATLDGTSKAYAFWSNYLRGKIKPMIPTNTIRRRDIHRNTQYYQAYLNSSGINHAFAQSVSLQDRLLEVESGLIGDNNLTHAEQHAQRIQHPSLLMAIERYERLARKHAIEARHPLLDISFIKFCLSLPPQHKNNGLVNKSLMRDSLRGSLPNEIVERPYVPSDHLARTFIRAQLSVQPQNLRGIVETRDILNNYFSTKVTSAISKASNTTDLGILWSTTSFMLWHR